MTKCRQRTIHAASLLCIHFSWPHFPGTFQASQYFIRVVREMCSIYYLALWVSIPYKITKSGKIFITALFCDKYNYLLWFSDGLFSHLGFLVHIQCKRKMIKKNWFKQAISLAKCLYLHWMLATKGEQHKRWHVEECAASDMTSYESLHLLPPNTHSWVHT